MRTFPRFGDLAQHTLRDLLVAVIAYQVLGWWGVGALVATYVIGTGINLFMMWAVGP